MKTVLFGAGHFGGLVAQGLVRRNFCQSSDLTIVQRGEHKLDGFHVVQTIEHVEKDPELLLICIRPQDFHALQTAKRFSQNTLICTVMAGIPGADVVRVFGGTVARAMPNIAASLGSGVTVYKAPPAWTPAQRAILERLLAHWGVGVPVEDEALLDAATAISGSGPGILFWFYAELCRAAEELGFSREVAEQLVRYTARGALGYWEASADNLPQLIENVASKGGTTEAALKSLSSDSAAAEIRKALHLAAERCRGLREKTAS